MRRAFIIALVSALPFVSAPASAPQPVASVEQQELAELHQAYERGLPPAVEAMRQATLESDFVHLHGRSSVFGYFKSTIGTTIVRGSYDKESATRDDIKAEFISEYLTEKARFQFSITLAQSLDPPFFASPAVDQIVVDLRKEGSPYHLRTAYFLDDLLRGKRKTFTDVHESVGEPLCAQGKPYIIGTALGTRYLCTEEGRLASHEYPLIGLTQTVLELPTYFSHRK